MNYALLGLFFLLLANPPQDLENAPDDIEEYIRDLFEERPGLARALLQETPEDAQAQRYTRIHNWVALATFAAIFLGIAIAECRGRTNVRDRFVWGLIMYVVGFFLALLMPSFMGGGERFFQGWCWWALLVLWVWMAGAVLLDRIPPKPKPPWFRDFDNP